MGDIPFRSPRRQKKRWQRGLLDLFERYICAAPKEGVVWSFSGDQPIHSPNGRRDTVVGLRGGTAPSEVPPADAEPTDPY